MDAGCCEAGMGADSDPENVRSSRPDTIPCTLQRRWTSRLKADIHDPAAIQCIPRVVAPRFSLVLAACLLATSHAHAEGLGGALGFANDNVYRGISLTAGRPAWLADLHYDLGTDWVIGLGGTAERPPRRSATAQVTAYIDRRWQLNEDWASKVGAIHYDGAGQGCPSAVSAGCAKRPEV